MVKKTHLSKISTFLVAGIILGTLPALSMEQDDKLAHTTIATRSLADEHVLKICEFLPPKSLGRVAPVSQQWNDVSKDRKLWEAHGVPSKEIYGQIASSIPDPFIYPRTYHTERMKFFLSTLRLFQLSKEQRPFLEDLIFSFLQRKPISFENNTAENIKQIINSICKISCGKNHPISPEFFESPLTIIKNTQAPEKEMIEILGEALKDG